MKNIYAHSVPRKDVSSWQTLPEHADGVAKFSEAFGRSFSSEKWCRLLGEIHDLGTHSPLLIAHRSTDAASGVVKDEALVRHLQLVSQFARDVASSLGLCTTAALVGLVHDFGKASAAFQAYLRASGECDEENGPRKGPDHSTAGARWLANESGLPHAMGTFLAYAAAGHHSGMPDGESDLPSCLSYRIKRKSIELWQDNLTYNYPSAFPVVHVKDVIEEFGRMSLLDALSVAGRVRMLYSTLVDADFLATETFMDDAKSQLRSSGSLAIADLELMLDEHLKNFDAARKPSPVDSVRMEIREACLKAAEDAPGLFTLEVPTGGGKTLSSMAFALKHARLHELDRVIYVIPYTSIIEQNAEVFRRIFGGDAVLEHHSNRDPDLVSDRQKLLAENWDAPIVVTTNVQFFESLYSNRASRCRKLHNFARSVIVLDEAQSLPAPFLRPCLHAIDELVCNCGSSVVVCTATLPTFFRGDFPRGTTRGWNGLAGNKAGVRAIAAGLNLEHRLVRVAAERIERPIADDELARRFSNEPAALVIVSTRRHARHLYECAVEMAGRDGVFHLSAQMCPAHRMAVLDRIRARLKNGERCLVVSTQLVEAGVDLDFPTVYREITGCDALVQAAGRCNREGKLELGRVVIFESAEKNALPRGDLQQSAEKGREVISMPEFTSQPLSNEAVGRYFRLRYNDLDETGGLDQHHVGELFSYRSDGYGFQFRTCAEAFHLIADSGTTVYIPHGEEGRRLCEAFRASYAVGEQRELLRRMGRYGVSIPSLEPRTAEGDLYAEKVHDLVWILTSPELNYSDEYGLHAEASELLLEV